MEIMRPSVFDRLEFWIVEWFTLNGKQANITKNSKTHENREFVAILWLIMKVSVDNYFSVDKIIENIVKIHGMKKILWLNLK